MLSGADNGGNASLYNGKHIKVTLKSLHDIRGIEESQANKKLARHPYTITPNAFASN
jgi:hypothetical protein